MNSNVNKETAKIIDMKAKSLHHNPHSIVNEALKHLDPHTQSKWPKNFFHFPPVDDVPDFKASRKELTDPSEDLF